MVNIVNLTGSRVTQETRLWAFLGRSFFSHWVKEMERSPLYVSGIIHRLGPGLNRKKCVYHHSSLPLLSLLSDHVIM